MVQFVEERVARGRVTVARLANRTRQPPPATRGSQRNLAARKRLEVLDTLCDPDVIELLLVDMSTERNTGSHRVHAAPGFKRAQDVFELGRRPSIGVHEQPWAFLNFQWQLREEAQLTFVEALARPFDGPSRVGVQALTRGSGDCAVVITQHRDGAGSHQV